MKKSKSRKSKSSTALRSAHVVVLHFRKTLCIQSQLLVFSSSTLTRRRRPSRCRRHQSACVRGQAVLCGASYPPTTQPPPSRQCCAEHSASQFRASRHSEHFRAAPSAPQYTQRISTVTGSTNVRGHVFLCGSAASHTSLTPPPLRQCFFEHAPSQYIVVRHVEHFRGRRRRRSTRSCTAPSGDRWLRRGPAWRRV
jgi:hypothetical protein